MVSSAIGEILTDAADSRDATRVPGS